uniref:Uncharacterized protein n=1 Tax=Arundo donax TaxID=35708 RepID=A0A0A9FVX7_ARUDO
MIDVTIFIKLKVKKIKYMLFKINGTTYNTHWKKN